MGREAVGCVTHTDHRWHLYRLPIRWPKFKPPYPVVSSDPPGSVVRGVASF